jgi:thiol:disulfide interchange protein
MKTLTTLLAVAFVASGAAFSADFPKGSPKFKTTLGAATSEAKKDNKPVIAIFSAVWCGPCQTMKRDVYPSDAVKAYHDKFVWAYLDADSSSNQASMKKFGVSGIPHIEFLDSAGKSVGKQVGSTSPDAFAKTLEAMLKKAGGAKTASAQ